MSALMLWLSVAFGALAIEPSPAVGQPTTIIVSDDVDQPRGGVTVRVRHRPGLTGETEVAVGVSDSLGRVVWKPEVPGVAEIRVDAESLPIHVAAAEQPVVSLTLLGLLALAAVTALGLGVVPTGFTRRRA